MLRILTASTLTTDIGRAILKQIAETYSSKVEASSKDCIIRVTSDYETSLDIYKLTIHTISNIKSCNVDLSAELVNDVQGRTDVPDDVLKQVMESTNTVIEVNQSFAVNQMTTHLQIYYIGPEDEDLENARRMINQIVRPRNRNTSLPFAKESTVLSNRPIRPTKDVLTPVAVGNALPMIDRAKRWSRWCSPSIRTSAPSRNGMKPTTRLDTLTDPLDQQQVMRALRSFYALSKKPYTVAEEAKKHWKSNKTYWDSAYLGQVLFPMPTSKIKKSYQPRIGQSDRTFVSLVPGMANALGHLGTPRLEGNPSQEEYILVRLTPSFKNVIPFPLTTLPDLEIHITLDETDRKVSVRDARLSYRNAMDLLLPSNTMDICFERRTCVYSRENKLDRRIQSFVDKSNFDIWGDNRLKTPAGLSLNIPAHSLRVLNDGRKTDGFEQYLIDYLFASLEHRSEIRIPFRRPESWADLTYTSIEGGKIGGRRDEVCLKQPCGMKMSSEKPVVYQAVENERHSASLLKKAKALINIIEHPERQQGKYEKRGTDGMNELIAGTGELLRQKRRQYDTTIREKGKAAGGVPIREVIPKARIRKLHFG